MSKEQRLYQQCLEKKEEFSGKAVCPFAGPELDE